MGYRIRVLGTKEQKPQVEDLQAALRKSKNDAILTIEAEKSGNWEQLILAHPKGPEIALIEWNPVVEGELGKEELEEFIAEVEDYEPASAACWLKEYLRRVKVIYALQLLSGTEVGNGWDAVHTVQTAIWNKSSGVLQSDGEGFTNEDGYHILWQFSSDASGEWNMAVLEGENWIRFQMDLGDLAQRKEFLAGSVPRRARRL
jgi:hypothetical protein